MERERVENAIGLGLMVLLCGAYLLDSDKPVGDEETKGSEPQDGAIILNKQNKEMSIWD